MSVECRRANIVLRYILNEGGNLEGIVSERVLAARQKRLRRMVFRSLNAGQVALAGTRRQ